MFIVEHLDSIIDSSPYSIFAFDREYRYIRFNQSHANSMKALYGAEIKVGGKLDEYQKNSDDLRIAKSDIDKVFLGELVHTVIQVGDKSLEQRFVDATYYPMRSKEGEINGVSVCIIDITDRKRMECQQKLSIEVLRILNSPQNFESLIEEILKAIQKHTEVDAIGIRLKKGDDFPYFIQSGFSDQFLIDENSLVAKNSKENICRSLDGKDCLECTCGLVLSGKSDPEFLPLSPGGSAWTNDSSMWLKIHYLEESRINPRNRCVREGYRSIAIIPIKSNAEIVGLLQLNERKKNFFSDGMIDFFEGLSASIGVALMRKQNEETLKKSEYFFRESQKSAYIGSYQADFIKDCWESSAVLDEIFGINDNYSRTIQGWLQLVHPDDRGDLQQYLMEEVIKKGRSFSKEYRIINNKSGEIRCVNGLGKVTLDANGCVLSLIGTIQDITEWKKAQEELRIIEMRYRNIFDLASDGIAVFSVDGVIISANDSFSRMHGYQHDEMIGMKLSEIATHQNNEGRPYRMQRIMNGDMLTFEVEHYHRDGHLFTLDVSAIRTMIEGKFFVQAFHRDISERKEDELNRQKYLSSIIDAQENECHRIAKELHDGVIQLLGATLHRLRSSSDVVVGRTAGDLLAKAIDETRRITYSLRPVVLDDLGLVPAIQSFCSEFEERTHKKINLKFGKISGSLESRVELAIYRIVVEALSNIEKHSQAKNVMVDLGLESSHFYLNISDDGKGIDFEKNLRAKSGLGLLHMKERAHGVGGVAFIESTIGQGTTISVRIPQTPSLEGEGIL